MSLFQWLGENKTWVFSGIGVLLLTIFARLLLNLFRRSTQGSRSQKQRAEAGTSVIQAGRDINVNVGSQRKLPTLRVLAHRAYFINNPTEHFFIKIVNITPDYDVEVTHVWYQNARRLDILSRPLPVRLRPNETWETYAPVSNIPHDLDAFKHFHVLISTGEVFTSEHNRDVPPAGYVAGR